MSAEQVFQAISLSKDSISIDDTLLSIHKQTEIKSHNIIEQITNNSILFSKLKNDSSLCLVGNCCDSSIMKLHGNSSPRQNFIESFISFNPNISSSIISFEIVSKQKHWDSTIYFMYVNWVSEAIEALILKFSNKQKLKDDTCKQILLMLSYMDLRLAALVLTRVIFPGCFALFGSVENLCLNLWEKSKKLSLSNQACLLKMGLIESIEELLSPRIISEYIDAITRPLFSLESENVIYLKDSSLVLKENEPLNLIPTETNLNTNEKARTKHLPISKAVYNEDECFNMIKEIRSSRFFVDVDIQCTSLKKNLDFQLDRLGRSLEHLSSKLYSEKLHFINEIFQNADDAFNKYSCNEDPTIVFIIEQSSLLIMYNEHGFDHEDILSLCDIGNSSKTESKFIGNKGIGFKSVFQISNRPEVHSNGFHICFNYEKYGSLGYVMPEWITYDAQKFSEIIGKSGGNIVYNTVLYLPFKASIGNTDMLGKQIFDAINGDLILFLNNLRRVVVIDGINNIKKNIIKEHVHNNLLSIACNDDVSRWIHIVEKVCIDHKSKKTSTNIAIAMKLTKKDGNEVRIPSPSIEPLYCFLPLRTYGFRFAINAPFELTSSRESLHDESEWNILLLANISHILAKSLSIFKKHVVQENIKNYWFISFVNYLPDPMDFFQPPLDYISKCIQTSLKALSFIPCTNNNLYPPSRCIFLPQFLQPYFDNSFLRFFISIDIFSQLMELYIVDIDMDSYLIEGSRFSNIVKYLGVSTFSLTHFFEFIRKLFDHSKELLLLPSKIGICLSLIMQFCANRIKYENDELNRGFEALRSLPMFPLTDNTFVSTSNTIVNIIPYGVSYSQEVLNLICRFFKVIHLSTSSILQEYVKDKYLFDNVLKNLNIQIFDEFVSLDSLVIQFYKLKNHTLKENLLMISYISRLWKISPQKININLIIEHGWIFCYDLSLVSLKNQIYIKNQLILSLEKEFKCTSWMIIHEAYLENDDLVDFLKILQLLEFPRPVNRCIKSLIYTSELNNIWKSCSTLADMSVDIQKYSYDLTNTNLIDIILNGDNEERIALSKLLDDYYDQYFSTISSYLITTDSDNTISSLALLLSAHPWLPTIDGNKFCKGNRLFNRTPSICNFLGSPTNSLISAYMFRSFHLITFLHIRCELTYACLSIIFRHWNSLNPFVTTFSHIYAIYKELSNSFQKNPDILHDLMLKQSNFIFVPNNKSLLVDSTNLDALVEGSFVCPSDVFYYDDIFLGKYIKHVPLSYVYEPNNLKNFFVNLLKVPLEPSFDTYLFIFSTQFCLSDQVFDVDCLNNVLYKLGLKCLRSTSVMEDNLKDLSLFTNISELYDNIKSKLCPEACDSLLAKLKYISCIPTYSGTLATPSTVNLFFCDDARLHDMFVNVKNITLVKIDDNFLSQTIIQPSKRLVGLICFLAACSIPKITSKCSIVVDDSFSKFNSNSDWSYSLSAALPYLYVYIEIKYPKIFDLLQKKQIWESVQKVEFIEHSSDTINVHFSINSIKVVKSFHAFCSIHSSGSVMHTLSLANFSEYLKGYFGNQTIEEFLRILNEPNPSLCRELASFIREIIITPSEQLPNLISRCGLEVEQFYSSLKACSTKSFLSQYQDQDFSSITYKVRYNEKNMEADVSQTIITPVIHPQEALISPKDSNSKDSGVIIENDKYVQIPKHLNMSTYSNSVGRWGEEVINQMLRTQKTLLNNKSISIIEVDWVNEQIESMLPYDFIIKTKHLDVEKSIYIEVKASSNPKSESFEVSIKEIEFAIKCGSKYHLYKVCPKGYKKTSDVLKEDDCDIKIYENLAHHFRKKFIRLVGIIK